MDKKIQAKHISEARICAVIEAQRRIAGGSAEYPTAALHKFFEAFPEYPPKVILARLRALVKSNKISAQCTCGCRGPYCFNDNPAYGSAIPEKA